MGRRDSTARRRLTGAGFQPENHLESGNSHGFPPGTTVDELRWYSRRKTNDTTRCHDNLHPETGSLKDITSEYTRCFKPPSMASHSLGDITDNLRKEPKPMRRFSSRSENMLNKQDENDNKWHKRSRRQNLKLEGDMLFKTENADEFIEYVASKRPDLLRRSTQLKLEGDFDTMTENREKYISFGNQERPQLLKRNTNLHLEGDHLYLAEYKDLFVDFPRKRPTISKPSPWLRVDGDEKMNTGSETMCQFIEHMLDGNKSQLMRRHTNLKCEGDQTFMPEYTASFRKYPIEKQYCIKQVPSFKLEGELYATPEYRDKFTAFPSSVKLDPIKQPDNLLFEEEPGSKQTKSSQALNILTDSGLTVSADNTAVVAKPPTSPKPPSPDLPKLRSKNETPFSPSSKTNNVNYPIPKLSRPVTPEGRLTARPPISSRARISPQMSLRQTKKETQAIADDDREFEPKYNIYGTLKTQPMKQPEDLLSNNLESRPEYRKAYLNYLIREKVPRKPDIDDAEDLTKNMGKDHKMYQPTLRRGSNTSMNSPRRRSASPVYRMQVTNVDEPKKGFGRRAVPRANEKSPRRGKKTTEYPLRRENTDNIIDTDTKFSSRSNWIKNIAHSNEHTTNMKNHDNQSFIVLDSINKDRNRKKWDSPWWTSSYN